MRMCEAHLVSGVRLSPDAGLALNIPPNPLPTSARSNGVKIPNTRSIIRFRSNSEYEFDDEAVRLASNFIASTKRLDGMSLTV